MNSHSPRPKRSGGFSLLELTVAMALGLVLLGAATQLFTAGMTTSSLVSNRSETQQELRTAMDLIAKDVSMAGAGLPPGGLQLPTGNGSTLSKLGCNQTPKCYLASVNYFNGTVGSSPTTTFSNYMFGVLPGYKNGMEPGSGTVTANPSGVPDSLTTIYVDYGVQFSLFSGQFTDNTGTKLTMTAPVPMPATLLPATDPGTGIKVGDLLLVTTPVGSAVGEVSVVAPLNTTGATITFTNLDPLNINQSGAASNNMKSILTAGTYLPLPVPAPATLPPVKIQRLLAITYFIEVPTSGSGSGVPRLMRQINGNTAQPVAENIIDMHFTYDLCDSGSAAAGCGTVPDPLAISYAPSQIHKVNIQLMGQSLMSSSKNSQSMQLSTAVSTRNLSFKDRYK